jgi:hypothetical protein
MFNSIAKGIKPPTTSILDFFDNGKFYKNLNPIQKTFFEE